MAGFGIHISGDSGVKLRKSYRIDGEDWDIVKYDTLMARTENYATTEFVTRKIIMDPGSRRIPVTLIHEALHIISDNAKLGLSEDIVQRVAHGIYAFIRDNKINFLED